AEGCAGGELRESGRGLVLVGSLARRWGHYAAPDRGKIVWCELAIAPVEEVRPAGTAGSPGAGPGPRGRSQVPDPRAAAGVVEPSPADVLAGACVASGPASPGDSPEASPGALPRRVGRQPVGAPPDGPDEATLLRVLKGLRALDVSGGDRR
ncbi:MAG: hypothetical protein IRZ07_28060, partial [Microbispora sp.]|nr:hypothetical protein [Microbispora sp.]